MHGGYKDANSALPMDTKLVQNIVLPFESSSILDTFQARVFSKNIPELNWSTTDLWGAGAHYMKALNIAEEAEEQQVRFSGFVI